MLKVLLKNVFGSPNDRYLKKFHHLVTEANRLEPSMQTLSDTQLKEQTSTLKTRLQQGETLDAILPEAFATVREASKRVLGLRPFDVQLLGGICLHKGMISEMKTGEGKTLVATLPVYLNALTGKGVHVVTVNDYLARRDSEWMGKLYNFLGLSVGCITHDMSDAERHQAYNADITYATNNELGFDYLRDNMKFKLTQMVQRPFHYAIVDEVDSILVDEARTPLIISGAAEDSSSLYVAINKVVSNLLPEDYTKDEKQNNVTLTESGTEKVEGLLREAGLLAAKTVLEPQNQSGALLHGHGPVIGTSLYDLQNIALVHHVGQALRAHTLYQKDKDYIVKDMKVILIDEFTGRMMDGRRYSDGLHQALEAKEDVAIQMENQTLASITFQNYFRMYPKLAGMTGTAATEALEFEETYKLQVLELPTNTPCVRQDHNDEVYRTEREKIAAVVTLIKECLTRKQPVLVGTASIEKSEKFSEELRRQRIPHNVLNARYHDKEASIIAEAGRPGAVTIATNMAGRGTDIKLGGNLEVRLASQLGYKADDQSAAEKAIHKVRQELEADADLVRKAGGLYIIGTERHESRRIDNQLRGRAGRQGDPGASKFFLSLEDDLMRIFGSDRLDGMLQKLGLKEGEAITHPWINRALEKAQAKVEAHNYDIRKHLLKYDNVMNDQRKVVYELRRDLMSDHDLGSMINDIQNDVVDRLIARHIPEKSYPSDWDLEGLRNECHRIFGIQCPIDVWAKEEGIADKELRTRLAEMVQKAMDSKFKDLDPAILKRLQKSAILRLLDQQWKDHLAGLDQLRQGINLRAYAQRDPLNEYKHEAFKGFEEMLERLKENVISVLCQFNFDTEHLVDILPDTLQEYEERTYDPTLGIPEQDGGRLNGPKTQVNKAFKRNDPSTWGSVSRNAPCPCESGKKYKYCHGQLDS